MDSQAMNPNRYWATFIDGVLMGRVPRPLNLEPSSALRGLRVVSVRIGSNDALAAAIKELFGG